MADEKRPQCLLDKHLHCYIDKGNFKVEKVAAAELLSLRRIDIPIKIRLAENILGLANNEYAVEDYLSHIHAFTLGTYKEIGSHKNGAGDYIRSFTRLAHSMSRDGFNHAKSIVPLSSNGVPVNGAHRIAIAACLNQEVYAARLNCNDPYYGVEYFEERYIERNCIERALHKLIELDPKYKAGIIWPRGEIYLSNNELVTTHTIAKQKLSFQQLMMLAGLAYGSEPWMSNEANPFANLLYKTDACFSTALSRLILIRDSDRLAAFQYKDKVRSYTPVGKHSIHTADDSNQSASLVTFFFNPTYRKILEKIDLSRLRAFRIELDRFRRSCNYTNGELIVSGSALIYLVGGRKPNDIDIITLGKPELSISHHHHLKKYKITLAQITQKHNIYEIMGIKFMSIELVLRLKNLRREPKDLEDINFISKLYDAHSVNSYKSILFISIRIRESMRRVVAQAISHMGLKHFLANLLGRKA
jgi:hypothetical protein